MRKGTVRDMKKKVLLRGLFGIPTGIAIGYVITVMMSAFWGDGSYYPCVPAFVDAMGSEIRAVVVQRADGLQPGWFLPLFGLHRLYHGFGIQLLCGLFEAG